MLLEGKNVFLESLQEKHFKRYHQAFSQTIRTALGITETASLEETKKFLKKTLSDPFTKIFFVIFNKQDSHLIGAIELRSIQHPNGEFGCWLHEKFWGKGLYQEALTLVLQEYFKKNTAITAIIKAENIRSFKAHQKMGFKLLEEYTKDNQKYFKIYIDKNILSPLL